MTLSLKTLRRSSCFNFLSCVVIAFGMESQEIMDVQSQLLFYWEFYQTLKLGWQNGRGFADWVRLQHTRRCPTPVLPQREETRSNTYDYSSERNISDVLLLRSATTDWQCGQQAKNSAQPFYSQARKMPFVLN